LPQNTIRSIVQSRDGYLWLTTFDGLARFDGVRFTVFNKSNTPGLNSNRFTSIVEDKYGTLWAGTEDGGLTAYRNGVFKTYTTADGLVGNHVVSIEFDRNGEIYLGQDNKFVHWREGKLVQESPGYDNTTVKYHWGASGKFWKIDRNGVTESKDGREFNYPIKLIANFVPTDVVTLEDRQGNLWLGNVITNDLYRFRGGQLTRYTDKEGAPKGMPLLPAREDHEGGIWFLTGAFGRESSGLARFYDGRFTLIGAEHGLPRAVYSTVLEDREGAIWAATSKGLLRLKKQFITAYSTDNGLAHNEVYPLLRTRNGDILIGSIRGLSRYRAGKFEPQVLIDPIHTVQALWEDRAGRLWIGWYGGLALSEKGKLKRLDKQTGTVLVNAIREDGSGAVWVATDNGLLKFNGEQLIARYTTNEGLPDNAVKVIHETVNGPRKGALWLGTYGGLAQFKDGGFINHTTAQGLAGNRVRSIYEDAEGTLWIGTYDEGLSRFRDGKFFNFRVEQGLPNNGVFQILEDGRGYFWISCNKGIYRVSRRELNEFAESRVPKLNSIMFGKQDGMLNSECNGGRQPAGLIADDGKFWFPTMGGIAVVDPEAVTINQQPPPVLIES
jgi:ligand-binding sensor domain-containing protein